jgi:signal peptidase II
VPTPTTPTFVRAVRLFCASLRSDVQPRLTRRASFTLLAALTSVLLIVDLLTKMYARVGLRAGESVPFIPGVMELYLTFNSGAAFGFFDGGGVFFVVIAFVAVVVIVGSIALSPRHAWLKIVALSLITAGALGNAADRVGDGEVTDFFNLLFIDFAVFNVADVCLTCGVALLFVWVLAGLGRSDTTTAHESDAKAHSGEAAARGDKASSGEAAARSDKAHGGKNRAGARVRMKNARGDAAAAHSGRKSGGRKNVEKTEENAGR